MNRGTRVKFSAVWLANVKNAEVSGMLTGIVISPHMKNDCVTVKWDHVKTPNRYHVNFLEVING